MKQLTVYLEDYPDLALARIAKRRGQSKAELIRETLVAFAEREQQAGADDAVPSWLGAGDSSLTTVLGREEGPRLLPRSVGLGRSGSPGWAERDDEILLELLERDHEEVLRSCDEAQKKKADR